MRKKILVVVLYCFMVIGICACSDEKKDSNVKDRQQISKSSLNKCFEAFREFYSEFYIEHRDAELTYDGNCYDCMARIVMDGESKPIMAICDFVVSGESRLADIYLFEYNGKEVITKASINSIHWNSDAGFSIYCIEDEIYIGNISGTYAYRVEDSYFVPLDTKYIEISDEYGNVDKKVKGFVTGLGENGLGASYLLNGTLHADCIDFIYVKAFDEVTNMSGTDFELFLKNMMEADIYNDLDLRFYYANYYLEKGLSDEDRAGVLIWEDGIYYKIYEDETATVVGIDSGYEVVFIPNNVEEYVVDKVGYIYGEDAHICYCSTNSDMTVIIPKNISDIYIGDIEALVISDGVTNVYVYNDSDSFEYIDNELKDTNILCEGIIEYIQVPNSVTDLRIDFGSRKGETIFCNEGSYAQQYAAENGMLYVIGTIENNKSDSPIVPLSYIENEVLPKYLECMYSYDNECALIYIDNNDIPELIIFGDYEAEGNIIYNFYNGTVYGTQLNGTGFSYIPKGNLFNNCGGHMDEYYDIIASIIDGKITLIASGCYGAEDNYNIEYDFEGKPIYQYYWNEQQVTEKQYETLLNQTFNSENIISSYNIERYDSIYEAYKNLNKIVGGVTADENAFIAEPKDSPVNQVCESFLKNTYVQWNYEELLRICDNTQNLSKDNYTYLNKYIEPANKKSRLN